MKTDPFQSCGHCWVFQIFWYTECSILTASSSRIWYNYTGIPSSPLALFIVMLPKVHLSSHSRMSDSRWVIIPSWLSVSWRSFLYSSVILATSSEYLLLLLGPYIFCPLLCSSLQKCPPGISNFLEESSSLSHSIAFLYFFALITKEGFLISPCYSWNSAFKWVYLSFSPLPLVSLFSAICKVSSNNHFAFCIFFP